MEVKARPRYIISERTWTKQNEDEEKENRETNEDFIDCSMLITEQEALPDLLSGNQKMVNGVPWTVIMKNDFCQ